MAVAAVPVALIPVALDSHFPGSYRCLDSPLLPGCRRPGGCPAGTPAAPAWCPRPRPPAGRGCRCRSAVAVRSPGPPDSRFRSRSPGRTAGCSSSGSPRTGRRRRAPSTGTGRCRHENSCRTGPLSRSWPAWMTGRRPDRSAAARRPRWSAGLPRRCSAAVGASRSAGWRPRAAGWRPRAAGLAARLAAARRLGGGRATAGRRPRGPAASPPGAAASCSGPAASPSRRAALQRRRAVSPSVRPPGRARSAGPDTVPRLPPPGPRSSRFLSSAWAWTACGSGGRPGVEPSGGPARPGDEPGAWRGSGQPVPARRVLLGGTRGRGERLVRR